MLRFRRCTRSTRKDGNDVLAVSEIQRRSVDKELMELALTENRILLIEDKDFGWLVFAARIDSSGVILIRFPASARKSLAVAVVKLVREHAAQLAGPSWFCSRARPVSVSDLKTPDEAIDAVFGREPGPIQFRLPLRIEGFKQNDRRHAVCPVEAALFRPRPVAPAV